MTIEFTPAGFDAFQNNITDVSTIKVGTASSTGTANQALQVGTASTPLGAYISGNLGIGTINPTSRLQVQGDVRITGVTTVSVGSTASPAFQFGSSLNGIHAGVTNTIDIVTNGSTSFRVDPDQSLVVAGTVAIPGLSAITDTNTGIYFPAEDSIAFVEGGAEAMRINSSGRVGIGTTNPEQPLHITSANPTPVIIQRTAANNTNIEYRNTTGSMWAGLAGNAIGWGIDDDNDIETAPMFLVTRTGGEVLINSTTSTGTASQLLQVNGGAYVSGNVGIGSINPPQKLTVSNNILLGSSVTGATATPSYIDLGTSFSNGSTRDKLKIYLYNVGTEQYGVGVGSVGDIQYHSNLIHDFYIANTRAVRIDSSGRVLVGVTSTRAVSGVNANLHVEGTTYDASSISLIRNSATTTADSGVVLFGRSRGSGTTSVQSGDRLGTISFCGADGTDLATPAAVIDAYADGIVGVNSVPGRIVFSTTPSGSVTPTERMRIDSSGRVLVGTSTARETFPSPNSSSHPAGLQIESNTIGIACQSIVYNANNNLSGGLILGKSRGTTIGSNTVVANGDAVGFIAFEGSDGSGMRQAAAITGVIDAIVGVNSMPGRIVFSTTGISTSVPTEAMRITSNNVIAYNQPTPTSKAAAATLTIVELQTGIIQYTGGAATLTLPSGTLTEGGFNGIYTNITFEWSVINTGSGNCSIGASTGHTIVGVGTVITGESGRFASRRTAANTFVTYRLS